MVMIMNINIVVAIINNFIISSIFIIMTTVIIVLNNIIITIINRMLSLFHHIIISLHHNVHGHDQNHQRYRLANARSRGYATAGRY